METLAGLGFWREEYGFLLISCPGETEALGHHLPPHTFIRSYLPLITLFHPHFIRWSSLRPIFSLFILHLYSLRRVLDSLKGQQLRRIGRPRPRNSFMHSTPGILGPCNDFMFHCSVKSFLCLPINSAVTPHTTVY